MPSLLAERLRRARHERFVGRDDERALVRRALRAEALPFHLLYLHGPGGVGKTALLQELRHGCEEGFRDAAPEEERGENGAPGHRRPVSVRYLDARDLEPTPAAFRRALDRADETAVESGVKPDHANDVGRRSVLMIDTFEALQPLARWFRKEFLPQIDRETLLVVAARTPPPPAWRAEAGVQAIMKDVPLRNLPPEESRRYLARRGVPEDQREAVADFACGHPLALSLASDTFDQNPDQTFAPERAPELVKTLLQRFLGEVPSPAHRRALEACALVRTLSERLLAHLLDATHTGSADESETRALFEWLRPLSFIEAGPRGLFPHDLAREVLTADLRWRHPDRYETLAQAARRFYTGRLRETADAPDAAVAESSTHEDVLSDYLFLYRDNPVVAPLFARLRRQWEGRAFTAAPPRPADAPALRAMTRRHEGDASAELFAHWHGHPAAQTTLFRDEEGTPAGFELEVNLREVSEADRARDPAVEAACAYLEAHAPLRGEETATLFRFWMDREEHQALSPVQSLISAHRVRHYLSTPRLAYSFIPCAEPEQWALIFAYADMQRLDDADYEIGDRTFALFGHDWRATPPTAWLERLAERPITDRPSDDVPPASPAPRLVLSREDFADAVKDALKHFNRPDRLRENPLTRAALAADGEASAGEASADPDDRAERLRRLLREAAKQLQSTPKEEQYYRALETTYLDPVGTQKEAAESVGAAFSTFRRHLGRGVDHVTEVLWKRETGRASGGVTEA
jgi:hypothetical protein